MQIKTSETKVKNTCDQLIAWGFCCSKPAEFIVKRVNSPEYAIMGGEHRKGFERQYPNESVEFLDWSLELNEQMAQAANDYWEMCNL